MLFVGTTSGPGNESLSLCGTRLQAVETRRGATVGGVFLIDGYYYGSTAEHVFMSTPENTAYDCDDLQNYDVEGDDGFCYDDEACLEIFDGWMIYDSGSEKGEEDAGDLADSESADATAVGNRVMTRIKEPLTPSLDAQPSKHHSNSSDVLIQSNGESKSDALLGNVIWSASLCHTKNDLSTAGVHGEEDETTLDWAIVSLGHEETDISVPSDENSKKVLVLPPPSQVQDSLGVRVINEFVDPNIPGTNFSHEPTRERKSLFPQIFKPKIEPPTGKVLIKTPRGTLQATGVSQITSFHEWCIQLQTGSFGRSAKSMLEIKC